MNKTILVVDDDPNLLRAVGELLRTCGYRVLEHSNPREALECFRWNAEINCVLTDIDMSGMDGISLLAELRQLRPWLDAIFMTGGARHGESFEEVLQKPFTSSELIQALENLGMGLDSQADDEPYVA